MTTLILTDITFIVKVSTPIYDWSTDAYRGQSIRIDEAFNSYEEAEGYCWENYNPHEVNDFDDVQAWVEVMFTWDTEDQGMTVIKERTLSDISPISQYIGPVTTQDSIPF